MRNFGLVYKYENVARRGRLELAESPLTLKTARSDKEENEKNMEVILVRHEIS